MDPNATYDELVARIQAQEWEDATEAARILWNWLAGGGFAPDRPEIQVGNVPNVYEEWRDGGLLPLVCGINERIKISKEPRP